MSEVATTIEIAAPVEDVWRTCLDPGRLHEWVTIHRGLVHSTINGAPRLGDTMEQRLSLRGATFKVSWELVACEPPWRAQWNGRGPARSKAETEYRLTDAGGGVTRFDYRNDFRAPGGPLGAVASRALVGGLPEREAHESLRRLKALLEAGAGR